MSYKLCIYLCFFVVIEQYDCARILGVFPVPSVSHQCVFQPIWRELSLRGHEMLIVTPNPLKDPKLINLTEIDTGYTYEAMKKHGFQYFMSKEFSLPTKIQKLFALTNELAELIFENEEFKKIYLDRNQKFDLILVQTYINPIMYSLSAKFGAPIIGISSLDGWVGTHYAMGNPVFPAIYSDMFTANQGHFTFIERFYSTLYSIWSRFYIHCEALPKGDKIVKKYLGNYMPYLGESERNLSALFLSIHPILHTARPMVPTIVPIGSIHLKESTKQLRQDLERFLDQSTEGVIYFSLGSNVKSINMPEKLKTTLIQAFSEVPFKILWKFEADEMANKPKNVIIKKWFPQQEILAHPNVKAFITQCGLQSISEAISKEVPLIALPFIADQALNTRKLTEFGAAIGLDYLTMTKDELKSAIIEVVTNNTYKEKVKEMKRIFNDQPMTSLERAVWWCEYVIRHKGTKHLRSPTVDISLYKFLLLDIISTFIVIMIFASIILKTIIYKFYFSNGNKIKKS